MNQKGNIVLGLVLLLSAVVGVLIVDQVALPMWEPTTVTNETHQAYNDGTITLNNPCVVSEPTGFYDWTNSTDVAAAQIRNMTPGTWPHRQSQTIGWEETGVFIHNDTLIGINYTYGCSYLVNDAARIVLSNYAIIVGIGLLVLAGAWLFMQK